MAINNKVVSFHKKQVQNLSARVSRAEQQYNECVKASVRFFMKWGYFSDELKTAEMNAYLKLCDVYGKYLIQEERYYRVKGVSLCQEESR